jgi:peptide/nickel transport system substrate-binding protein
MRIRLFSLIASFALLASACGSAATTSPSGSQAGSVPPPPSATPVVSAPPVPVDITNTKYKPEPPTNFGGTLIEGISGEPVTIWYGIYDTFANDVDAFARSLWSLWNNTSDLKFYGQLAADVPTTANGEVKIIGDKMDVTINLRPGAQWSDGMPITCDDVIYQVKWQLDKGQVGNVLGQTGYEDIDTIDGAGTSTCVVHFKKIYEQYLGLWTPLLPAHYLKTVSVADASNHLYTNTDPASGVYSGPYIPTTWAAKAEIDYKPNAKFWDTIKKSKAPFDAVKLIIYGSFDAEIAAFKKGDIDIGLEFNHTNIAAMKAAGIDDKSIDIIPGVTYENETWNFADLTKKLGDAGAKTMMEALHYAIDKDAINARVLGNTVVPSCSFTSNLTWFYADIPCYKFDAAKAAQILKDGGFVKGSDGTLATADGKKAEFIGCIRSDRPYRIATMTLVASQLATLGIKLAVKTTTQDNLFAGWTKVAADTPCNLVHGNFTVAEYANLALPDPVAIYYSYHSKFIPDVGDHSGQNYARVSRPDLDALLDEIKTTVDLVKIKDAMAKIQALFVDPANAFPEIALYNWQTVLLKSPKMHNVSNNSSAATQSWNDEDLWREP